jgi:hypothetical protein
MAKEKPEARLIRLARAESKKKYGKRIREFKHHGSAFSEAGVSDVIGVLDGVFFACEFKAPESYRNSVDRALRDGPTLNQKVYIQDVIVAGGVGWFAATIEHWMLGLEAVELQARGELLHLPPLVSGNGPICTCLKGDCEWDEEVYPSGCFYCRNAPVTEPCPNNPNLMV